MKMANDLSIDDIVVGMKASAKTKRDFMIDIFLKSEGCECGRFFGAWYGFMR